MFQMELLRERYTPLYLLASLGAGGMAVAFYLHLMFLTSHPDTPVPTWDMSRTLLGKSQSSDAGRHWRHLGNNLTSSIYAFRFVVLEHSRVSRIQKNTCL